MPTAMFLECPSRIISQLGDDMYKPIVGIRLVLVVLLLFTLTACGKDGPTEPDTSKPAPAPVATRIIVSPSSVTLDAIGQTAQLNVQVFDQNDAPMSSAIVAWTSGDDVVATVSAAGLVTAVGSGSTVISAGSEEASATANVTVMQTAHSIVVEPRAATLTAVGETVHLSATVLDRNEQPVGGAAVSWTSSDPGVATVDEEGLVTAIGKGNARITARSVGTSASVTVSVVQTAHSIVVEPQAAMLTAVGETVQLAATVLDRNEQPVGGAVVSWTSSDPGVATVDEEGLVTAVDSGDARITASHSGFSATVQIQVEIANPDRDTLFALYNALGGPNWTHSTHWLSDLPLGDWHGVETDDEGSVTGLDLGFNNLSGRIPPEMGNLANLQELYLYDNAQLSCVIPPELGNLSNLRRLAIFSTQSVPAIFPPVWDPVPDPMCTIPPELGNLANLEELHLGTGKLTGSIPSELGNLANLQRMDLGYNALSGSIPSALGNLAELQSLRLGFNTLSGSVPRELGNLANLRELNIGLNMLSGGIPPELGNLSNLRELNLELNALSGSIPPALGNLSELTYLSMMFNEDLSGPLPDTFTRLENLETLILYSTGLCVPTDEAFQAWSEKVPVLAVEPCEVMQEDGMP